MSTNSKIPNKKIRRISPLMSMTIPRCDHIAELIFQVAKKFGGAVLLPRNMINYYLFNTPTSIAQILNDKHNQFTKEGTYYDRLKYALRDGLLTNSGQSWRSQRKQLQPYFHYQQTLNYGPDILIELEKTVADFTKLANQGNYFDIHQEMLNLTLGTACRILFNYEMTPEEKKTFIYAIHVGNRFVGNAHILFPKWFPSPASKRFHQAMDIGLKITNNLITHCQNHLQQDSLINLIFNAVNPDNQTPISKEMILDEVFTFIVTGHETLGLALSWTWLTLSQNPHVKEKFHAELKSVLNNRLPTIEDCKELNYTKAIFQEAMRLYPPIWCNFRRITTDGVVDGYTLKENSKIMLSQYAMNRLEYYWDDAEQFIPERFLGEKGKNINKHIYFPFGGGQRICVASHFATIQAQMILATLGQHFDLQHDQNQKIKLACLFTLKPKYGIRIKAVRRKK